MQNQQDITRNIRALFANMIEGVEVCERAGENGEEQVRVALVDGVELPRPAQEAYFVARGFVRSSYSRVDTGFFQEASIASDAARLVAGYLPCKHKAVVFTQPQERAVKIHFALVPKDGCPAEEEVRPHHAIDIVTIKDNPLAPERIERKKARLQAIADDYNNGKFRSFCEAKRVCLEKLS